MTNVRRLTTGLLALALTLLAPTVAAAQTDTVIYYHTDAIGSVRPVTDSAGQVIARHDYAPFGQPWPAPPANADVRQFAGKERDPETEFNYFGARYYGSGTGRFTTVDPALDIEGALEDPQRWNRYAYALNNPLAFKDDDGCVPIPVIVAAVTAYAASPAGQRAMIATSTYLQRYSTQLHRIALTSGQGDFQ